MWVRVGAVEGEEGGVDCGYREWDWVSEEGRKVKEEEERRRRTTEVEGGDRVADEADGGQLG